MKMRDAKTKQAARIQSLEYRQQRAARIKRARRHADLTILEMSRLIGLSQDTYRKIENGEVNPRVQNLELIAVYTSTDVGYLFFGDAISNRDKAVKRDTGE